jgi:hypothetical protein
MPDIAFKSAGASMFSSSGVREDVKRIITGLLTRASRVPKRHVRLFCVVTEISDGNSLFCRRLGGYFSPAAAQWAPGRALDDREN